MRRQVSSRYTPDIALPVIDPKDWTKINCILCVDESLNNSGAALFRDGKYCPVEENGKNVGLYLTPPRTNSQFEKIMLYHNWVMQLAKEHQPEAIIVESHPFMRGSAKTSLATMEALIGVKYVTMVSCGTLNIPYAEFSTNHVKTIMCGSPSATKDQMQSVLKICGYDLPLFSKSKESINDNVCDAIAMGEVLTRMQRQEKLLREYSPSVGQGRSQTSRRSTARK